MSTRPLAHTCTRILVGSLLGLTLAFTGAVSTPSAQVRPRSDQRRGKPVWYRGPRDNRHRPPTTSPLSPVPGRNVNMVSGYDWPNGDPFLQRQNEPSVAASTRNPLHLVAGANDYRTVDLPGLPDGDVTGDAWVGLFKSFDGGQTWRSTLVPGYPQDASCDPARTPHPDPARCGLFGYQAAADPVVRAGTSGLVYYSGLAFDRGAGGRSAIFVARFIDNNNKEGGDSIVHLGTTLVASDPGATFIDKPWLAVDIPRGPATCQIVTPGENGATITETVPAGPAYVAYTEFSGTGTATQARIMFTSSADCGAHWTAPVRLSSTADQVNQGASIAIDPLTGNVYVAWRRFATVDGDSDAIMVARSANFGRSFGAPGRARRFPPGRAHAFDEVAEHRRPKPAKEVATLASFDQGTSAEAESFRTNAYPTMTFDDQGRLYVAWTERGFASLRPDPVTGDARIVMVTSRNGTSFTAPRAVADEGQPGHQLMPTLAFGGGHLLLVYYDLREDVSQVFSQFVDDQTALAYPVTTPRKRHTMDIRASMGVPGDAPVFEPSAQVSDYLMGSRAGGVGVEQLQFNPPDLTMFQLGTVPFMGDYIDVAQAPAFVTGADGRWRYNTQDLPVFHAVWTDNRDVRQPADLNGDGNPWNDFTPPVLPGTSIFDPTQSLAPCQPSASGSRNQNIYTARITGGLLVGSPGNTKPLSADLQRGFVVFAQNQTNETKSFRLTIQNQPVGGDASFDQFDPAVTSVDVTTPPLSLAARTVYVTSSDPHTPIDVSVAEIEQAGATGPLAGGLAGSVRLNPDISNPDISNPDISNPDISNPDISNAEVYNPDISNPDISNPDISNPDISNPDISNPDISNPDISNVRVANPDISNPDISNPDISNPDISNPDISNPDISNPDISNGAIADITWTVTNQGNTTSSFNVNMFLGQATAKLCPPGTDGSSAGCINVQLVLYKTYNTPTTTGCTLQYQTQNVLVSNIPNPDFIDPNSPGVPDPNDPAATNATLWLGPGESGKITLRLIDPDRSDNVTVINSEGQPVSVDPAFVPTDSGGSGGVVTPVLQSQGVGTDDKDHGVTTPPIVTPGNSTLFFVQQPTTVQQGAAIAPPVTVQVRDGYGAVVPGASVTMALGSNPTGATLAGTLTALTDGSGVATFATLTLDRPGTYTLSAVAASFQPVTSSPFTVVGAICSFPTCGPPAIYPTPPNTQPYTLDVSDLDGDGHPDIVVVDIQGDQLFKFMNLGYGTFAAPVSIGAGVVHSAAWVDAADVNGDNKPDLVVVNDDLGAGVTVFYNDGMGGFTTATPSTTPIPGIYAFPVAVADVNGDGHPDILTGGNGATNLYVLLNDGTGHFPAVTAFPTSGQVNRIVVGDFNEDTHPDVAASDNWTGPSGSHVLSIMLNDGSGGFTETSTIPVGDGPRVRPVGDLNGDGHVDLGLTETPTAAPGAHFAVLYGDGSGGFGPPVEVVPSSQNVVYGTSGDFNGDGKPDLAVGEVTGGQIAILLGDGAGHFGPPTAFALGVAPNGFVPADLDGNGTIDLALSPLGGEYVEVLPNNCGTSASTDLSTASSALPSVNEGGNLVYTVTVHNAGPDGATGVVLNDTLPSFSNGGILLPVVSIVPSQGTCAPYQTGVRCELGTIAPAGDATVTITITSRAAGVMTSYATALANESDPAPGNNTSFASTTVNDTGETLVVTNTNDSGAGSLRQAINLANLDPGPDSIAFDIPGPIPHVIAPTTPLPAVTTPIAIDATGQPDYDGRPTVELSGASVGGGYGLQIKASNTTVRGLAITGFPLDGLFAWSGVTGVVIDHDTIGTDRDGAAGKGNLNAGIRLRSSASQVTTNVISGNQQSGILVEGSAGNTIVGNTIGVAPDGVTARPNAWSGITMYDGSANTVIQNNTISGNGQWGIDVQHSGALAPVTGTQIIGNTIGLDGAGNAAGNGSGGVRLDEAPDTAIGTAGAGNVISGNIGGHGIDINGSGSTSVTVQANTVGADPAGTAARPNGPALSDVAAIMIESGVTGVTIGGDRTLGEGNLVSGNNAAGIKIWGHDNFVYGNRVGTNAAGTAALPNQAAGVQVEIGPNNTIGGAGNLGNLVSGNVESGIMLSGQGAYAGAVGTVITHNIVGLDAAGATAVPNTAYGVDIREGAAGVVTDNTIAGNASAGVVVWQGATGSTIQGNRIGPNGGLGIDLEADGVTANDPGDGDTGSNNRQNYPVLGAATTAGVQVSFNSTPNTTFTLEFFSSAAADPSGYGEGETPIGTTSVATDGSGNIAAFTYAFPSAVSAGAVITATATDVSTGNTSEFSNASTATSAPTITSVSPTPTATGAGQMLTIRGANLPATGAADVLFSQGGPEVAATYTWAAGPSQVIARLPGSLTPGPATVRLKNPGDTTSTGPYPITISIVPSPPVVTLFEAGGCAGGGALTGTPLTTATTGQSVTIEADGIDSSNGTVWFTPSVGAPFSIPVGCTTGGASGGVAASFVMPSFSPGITVTIQMKTTATVGTSALSNPVVVTIY